MCVHDQVALRMWAYLRSNHHHVHPADTQRGSCHQENNMTGFRVGQGSWTVRVQELKLSAIICKPLGEPEPASACRLQTPRGCGSRLVGNGGDVNRCTVIQDTG